MKVKPALQKGKVVLEMESRDEALLQPLPFQVRRILVPVDFSETSKKALRYAVPFAESFKAELTLLYVTQAFTAPAELGYMPPELTGSQREIVESAREGLNRLCGREIGSRAPYEVKVRDGVPWQEVVDAAREENADLIILATHGHTGLRHVLLGSVAERVVRHASCPVLVVRQKGRDFIRAAGEKSAE